MIQVTLDAERQPRGTLLVDSNGIAEVWIDGAFSGFTTPTVDLRVPIGVHTVEVHADGVRSPGRRITVRQGQTIRLLFQLTAEPSPGQPR
jgi:hypothetical protein